MEIIAVFGPTGVGKTDVAVALAERLADRGERPVAVSADALQVYRGLEILTGVADEAQQRRLEHRLVSFLDVSERFSVGQYALQAHAVVDGLLEEGRRPIVVGGTGLYLRAALTDLQPPPPAPAPVRATIERELEAHGPEALHDRLRAVAPQVAERLDPHDRQRLVRALELHAMGEELPTPDRLWTEDTRRPTRLIGLVMQRDVLYRRIDARVDAMVAAGAIDEVRAADAAGAQQTARQAVGFAELLVGDVGAMKQRTRRYAKRQLTWMRKLPGVELVDVTGRSPQAVAAELLP